MIRGGKTSGSYKVWKFGAMPHNDSGTACSQASNLCRHVRDAIRSMKDPAQIYATMQENAKREVYKNRYAAAWKVITGDGKAGDVSLELWGLSTTGEVNITEFKDKFKEAVAVQWDIIRLDNVIYDIVLI